MFMTLADNCVLFTFYCCTDRSKHGLFHRANWNAKTYRWAMSEVVFALYDIIPDDDNKLSRLFAAFLSVYMITEDCLDALHEKLKVFHRQQCFRVVVLHLPDVL